MSPIAIIIMSASRSPDLAAPLQGMVPVPVLLPPPPLVPLSTRQTPQPATLVPLELPQLIGPTAARVMNTVLEHEPVQHAHDPVPGLETPPTPSTRPADREAAGVEQVAQVQVPQVVVGVLGVGAQVPQEEGNEEQGHVQVLSVEDVEKAITEGRLFHRKREGTTKTNKKRTNC